MEFLELRAEVVRYAQRLVPDGLVKGTSGNISVRDGDVVAVTPGAMEYSELTPESIPLVRLDGELLDAPHNPSSEVPLHLGLYRRHDVSAVVHTHSTYATVLSVLAHELPSVHYMTASMGGAVPVVAYERYGSARLAEVVADAMEGRSAVIMGNHGAVTVGGSLRQAYNRSLNLEWMAQVYVTARNLGTPRVLSNEEISAVSERMTTRGYLPTS